MAGALLCSLGHQPAPQPSPLVCPGYTVPLSPLSAGWCQLSSGRTGLGMTYHTLPGPGSGSSRELRAPRWGGGKMKVTKVTYPGDKGGPEEGEASS